MDGENVGQPKPDLKQRVASLFTYLAKHLGIKTTPKVVFTNDVKNAEKPFGLTGYYDPESKAIRIFISNRHETDILRTFAHEIVHHWQRENGTLNATQSGDGYAQADPNLRKREMEAYLFGNMLFRDWQDENRYGPPAVTPPMPPLIKENFQLDPQRLKSAVERFVQGLISTKAFSSYHRERTSGDMQTGDFASDLNKKVLSAIQQWVQRVNDRGNWENQPMSKMIKETDEKWDAWVQSMVATVEDTLLEMGEHYTHEGEVYDILKTNFRADAPSRDMFNKASAQAMAILKSKGRVGNPMTECKKCGHKCDQGKLTESRMGFVKCPQCKTEIDQEGNYGRV